MAHGLLISHRCRAEALRGALQRTVPAICERLPLRPMSVGAGFLQYVLEQLERLGGVSSRRMFGAVGLYRDDVFFALIDDDTLYFKVDDSTRPDYASRGMEPFRPYGPDREGMQYYCVPAEILEDAEALGEWVQRATAVARQARKRPRRR